MAYPHSKITVYLAYKAQIALLVIEKVIVPAKSLDFADVFSKKWAAELPEQSDINKHLINLKLRKQLLYNLIYNPNPVKFKTLKIYIKINLANHFI